MEKKTCLGLISDSFIVQKLQDGDQRIKMEIEQTIVEELKVQDILILSQNISNLTIFMITTNSYCYSDPYLSTF